MNFALLPYDTQKILSAIGLKVVFVSEYSRTWVARTLWALFLQLFRTCS